ncbi:MAG TPA: hypothetical protein PLF40_17490 [Kofleriaceae bacterium]|nr:hypothetical protein [Kofleriaceae bacterium]
MTFHGRRIAFFIALAVAFALPKDQPCSYPGEACEQVPRGRELCTPHETEPLGVYMLETVFRRDLWLRYSTSFECY